MLGYTGGPCIMYKCLNKSARSLRKKSTSALSHVKVSMIVRRYISVVWCVQSVYDASYIQDFRQSRKRSFIHAPWVGVGR